MSCVAVSDTPIFVGRRVLHIMGLKPMV